MSAAGHIRLIATVLLVIFLLIGTSPTRSAAVDVQPRTGNHGRSFGSSRLDAHPIRAATWPDTRPKAVEEHVDVFSSSLAGGRTCSDRPPTTSTDAQAVHVLGCALRVAQNGIVLATSSREIDAELPNC